MNDNKIIDKEINNNSLKILILNFAFKLNRIRIQCKSDQKMQKVIKNFIVNFVW